MKIKPKKHVAVIIPGGISTLKVDQYIPVLQSLIRSLSEIYMLTVYSVSPVDGKLISGIQIKSPPHWMKPSSKLRLLFIYLRLIVDHFTKPFQLLHSFWGFPQGLASSYLSTILSIPSLVSLQGGEVVLIPSINYGYLKNRSNKNRLLRLSKRADLITVLSQFQYDLLLANSSPSNAVPIIPFGVNTQDFPYRQKSLIGPIKLVHIAGINKVKQQTLLIDVVAKIIKSHPCILTIVGPDFLDGSLHRYVDKMQLNSVINFVGKQPNLKLKDYLKPAHFLVHTSHYESQGVVISEAAASGVVVAGTPVGSIHDHPDKFIQGTTSAELASAIITCFNSPTTYMTYQKKARDWVKTYDQNWTLKQFCSYYDLLMN
jgi:glycosyltransferase involved in cell wall biosynthesis